MRLTQWISALGSIGILFLSGVFLYGAVPADRLFPETTKGFLSVSSLSLLSDQWKKTQIGKLMNDDIMRPFVEDVRRQIGERFTDRFGVTLEGIEKLPSGELAAGLVVVPEQTPGFILTMDVTGREKETQAYFKRLSDQFVKAGATQSMLKAGEDELTVLEFPNKEKDDPAAPRKAFYLHKASYFMVSDQAALIELFAKRLVDEKRSASLADVASYVKVMARVDADLPKTEAAEELPLVRWYVEPLDYGKAVSLLVKKPEKRKNKRPIVDILAEQGFDAILGIGGNVSIKAEDKEVVHRSYVLAPKPHRLAMKMFSFPNAENFGAPKWMPRDLASCVSVYIEPLAIFDNFGSLFDSLIMEEEGVWEGIFKDLEEDQNGPQINMRKELIEHLAQRVMVISKYTLPITISSESLVAAVEIKEGKADSVAAGLEKFFAGDVEIQKSTYKGAVIWQNKPPEDDIKPFELDASVPPLTFGPENLAPAKSEEEEEDKRPPTFPNGGITVANGCLFLGTNVQYMQEILDRLDEATENIAHAADYKVVDLVFADMGMTKQPHFFQAFARTDETIRPTYEMIREGKMPQSQSLLGKIVNAIFANPDEPRGTVRKQQIDGSKMPEFESIRRHFGPAGLFGVTEEEGWFIKGFLLEK